MPYVVLATAPSRLMLPLLPPQVVGLVGVIVLIVGVGFTITVAVPAIEVQLLTVTVRE